MKTDAKAHAPRALPLVGHLPAFLADKLGFLMRCAERNDGDIIKLQLGAHTYLLNNPADIKHVLETNHANYTKTPRLTSERGRRLSGQGLLTSSGQQHLTQRRMMQPMFHHHMLAPFGEQLVRNSNDMIARWQDGAELNIHADMMTLAHRNIGRVLFGVDVSGAMREFGEAIIIRRRYLDYWFASLFPWPERLPNRMNREYREAMKVIDTAIYGMIRARRDASTPPQDLLTMLMLALYKDGSVMNDQQVRDEALTLAITGYETLGEALTWTWYLLAQHPEVEATVCAELQRVLGGRTPTVADLPTLRYTEMVFSESMRMYPPTWIYVRIAQNADLLPAGTQIRAGAKLYLSPYVMQRNPRYFPEPERFDPSRFEGAALKSRPKFAYFPFGGGPRVCIGQGLAMMEGMLVLATVVPHWRLALVTGQTITPEPGITLHPKNGIMMRIERRAS